MIVHYNKKIRKADSGWNYWKGTWNVLFYSPIIDISTKKTWSNGYMGHSFTNRTTIGRPIFNLFENFFTCSTHKMNGHVYGDFFISFYGRYMGSKFWPYLDFADLQIVISSVLFIVEISFFYFKGNEMNFLVKLFVVIFVYK